MTPQEHQEGLNKLIGDIYEKLSSETVGKQNDIYNRLAKLLKSPKYKLDTKADGSIKPTGKNLKRIAIIIAKLRPHLLDAAYKTIIEKFSSTFEEIEKFNNRWFSAIFDRFKPKPVYQDVKTIAVERTIQTINPEGFREALEMPIREILSRYVQTGGDILDMSIELEKGLKGIREIERGPIVRGYLEKYHWRNRITKDALFQYSRNYDQVISENLGIEWFLYSGGLVEDSRDFCEEKNGYYYHINEVKSWAGLSWQGKAAGTNEDNIQSELGGYNCAHSLRPVSLRLVPKKDVERARRLGFID